MALALMRCSRFAAPKQWRAAVRLVSTSSQKNDTHGKEPTKSYYDQIKDEPIPDFSIDAARKTKNWISYGFDLVDRDKDRQLMKATYFMGLSVVIIGYIFVWSYLPDMQRNEWAQREAYLVLRDREEAGLEPIAPDYYDPTTVVLPTDEELGDFDVIV